MESPWSCHLRTYMALLNEAQVLVQNPKRHNLIKAEFIAKKDLANDKSIVIKKADKGSAVVVQNRSDYIKEGLRQLSDQNFYRQTKSDLTSKNQNFVKIEVQRLITTKEISDKTGQYLVFEKPQISKLNLLPKIHKNVVPPPGRPIVSSAPLNASHNLWITSFNRLSLSYQLMLY